MRALWIASLLAAGLFVLSGCEDWGDWGSSDRYKEDFHYSYALKPGGTVSVENFNGPVEIMSWEQDTVEVNGTKHASQRSYLDDMKIDISATPGSVRIRTIRPSISHGNFGASYSIRVPKRVMLDEIASSNGGIRIDRIEGNARLRTSNGGVRVDGLKGELNARTTNGSIELRDVDGNVRVHTSNGHIDAETTHGSFEAETSNSKIEATLLDPAPDWPIRLNTSNGHIELTLRGAKLPDLHADTSNSSIVLHLPASVNARVRGTTSRHSSITSEFDELLRDGSRSEVDGRIGSGGPLLDLSTSNGPIKILKL
jgi:DUF4097 and DUF4098 domain-containing protein YvlB